MICCCSRCTAAAPLFKAHARLGNSTAAQAPGSGCRGHKCCEGGVHGHEAIEFRVCTLAPALPRWRARCRRSTAGPPAARAAPPPAQAAAALACKATEYELDQCTWPNQAQRWVAASSDCCRPPKLRCAVLAMKIDTAWRHTTGDSPAQARCCYTVRCCSRRGDERGPDAEGDQILQTGDAAVGVLQRYLQPVM